jgi:large subunit ribosomal protein L31
MKTKIHPQYVEARVHCACGNEWHTRSTKADLHVEICSNCHPFFTGQQRIVDTAGRVERFAKRLEKSQVAKASAKPKKQKKSTIFELETPPAEESVRVGQPRRAERAAAAQASTPGPEPVAAAQPPSALEAAQEGGETAPESSSPATEPGG